MPAINSVVLTDRESTPVDHTFAPVGREDDGGRYIEADLSPLGDNTLTIIPRTTPSGRRKVDISLSVPTLVAETINSVVVYTVARTARAKVSLDFDQATTQQERDNIMGMLEDALGASTAQVNDVVVDGEMIY
jgi:hypothetical protein